MDSEEFFFVRPRKAQKIAVGLRVLPSKQPRLFGEHPTIGLVITTFGGVPFVELNLEVRKGLYPQLPVLVHDDASAFGEELAGLCDRHHVEFETNSSRLGHEMGDLSGLVGGLRWAKE